MIDYGILYGFLVALGVGFLIGLERERKQEAEKEPHVAGVRTFTLISLLGTTTALISETSTEYVPAIITLGVIILIGLGHYFTSLFTRDIGLTTEFAMILVFLFGFLAFNPTTRELSVIFGIVTALILALKEHIHEFARNIEEFELIDTLKFAVIAFIILPILPDTAVDPYGVVNPRQLWLLVVLISAISYVGYVMVKLLGVDRGIGITGFVGGLASSTAVTTAMAAKSKKIGIIKPTAFAAIIASSVMFPRIVFEILVVNRDLLFELSIPMFSMLGAGIISSFLIWHSKSDVKAEFDLKTPFAIKPALKFAAFFLGVLFLQYFARIYLGNSGLYAVSIISGLADVDAVTLSTARMAANGEISVEVAVNSIVIAAIANTIMKVIYAFAMGNREFGKLVAIASATMILAGVASIILL